MMFRTYMCYIYIFHSKFIDFHTLIININIIPVHTIFIIYLGNLTVSGILNTKLHIWT